MCRPEPRDENQENANTENDVKPTLQKLADAQDTDMDDGHPEDPMDDGPMEEGLQPAPITDGDMQAPAEVETVEPYVACVICCVVRFCAGLPPAWRGRKTNDRSAASAGSSMLVLRSRRPPKRRRKR